MSFRITRIKPTGITFGMTGLEARGWPCPYCATIMTNGRDDRHRLATTDHVLPVSRGGPDRRDNYLAVCHACNNDKANFNPFEWAGILLYRKDTRFAHVSSLIEIIADHADYDDKMRAEMYAMMGRGYLMGKRNVYAVTDTGEPARRRRPITIPPFVETPELARRRRAEETERLRRIAETAVSALRIPRTHWTFDPPDRMRILIGSISETFTICSVDQLCAEILAHPRRQFLALTSAA